MRMPATAWVCGKGVVSWDAVSRSSWLDAQPSRPSDRRISLTRMGLRGCGHTDVRLPSPLEEVNDEFLREHGVRLLLKRDDLISAEVPGNKWRKLHLNLQAAHEQGRSTLLTFGGAYSNHIRAVAAAGRACGFSTIGVIRGEEHLPLNWSLAYATGQGMRLEYLDRTTYRAKHMSEVIDGLRERFGDFYLLPEGGSNALAVRGCAAIADEIEDRKSVV